MEKETRVYQFEDLEVRQATDGEKPEIIGYPAVYNVISEDLGGFREMVEPGFFEDVIEVEDTRAVQNHDPNLVLGRKSAGTLYIEDTPKGLRVRIIPPDTQYARDLLTVMNRGDVDQMSFQFAVRKDGARWERTDDGKPLRILQRGGCAILPDIAVVTWPAYPQTSAEVRAQVKELTETDGDIEQALNIESDDEPEGDQGQARRSARRRRIKLAKARGKE